MLQIVIYKKTQFLGRIYTPASQAQGERGPAPQAGAHRGVHAHQRSDRGACGDSALPWRPGAVEVQLR